MQGEPTPPRPRLDLSKAGSSRLEALYNSVTKGASETPRSLHVKSILAMQNARLGDAAELAGKAVAAQPESPDYQRQLGFICAEAGWPRLAILALNRAIYLDPKDFEAWFVLGQVFDRNTHAAEARICYSQAINLEPRYVKAKRALKIVEAMLEPV